MALSSSFIDSRTGRRDLTDRDDDYESSVAYNKMMREEVIPFGEKMVKEMGLPSWVAYTIEMADEKGGVAVAFYETPEYLVVSRPSAPTYRLMR